MTSKPLSDLRPTSYNDRNRRRRTTMIMTRLLRLVLPSFLACTAGLQLAHADIYTWVDGSGSVNVSNVAPPEGVHVTKVTHESAPKSTSRPDSGADAARQAEVQALAARVRELEHEVDVARNQAPTIEYRAAPARPPVQYGVGVVPPVPQYAVSPVPEYINPVQSSTVGCDPAWMTCGSWWWGQPIYSASIVVLRAQNFHHLPSFGGHHHFGGHQPVRGSGPSGFHPHWQARSRR